MAKEYPVLHKINIYIKRYAHVSDKETRWVKDTAFKIWACYLAQKHTPYSNREIAGFFNINPGYMIKNIQHVSVQLLMDDELKGIMNHLEKALKELDEIHA